MPTQTRCPACGSSRFDTVVELDESRRARFLDYSRVKYGGLLDSMLDTVVPAIDRCADCGHCWYRHQPSPDQLSAMYAAGRPLIGGSVVQREPSAQMLAEMTRLRRLAKASGRADTLLDFGSGHGRWARAALQAGFRVTAFDPSDARSAEEGAPFELVHHLDALRGRRFSVIQLEQVLEHVPDPQATLAELLAFCENDTILRITVPNLLRAPEGANLWASWPFDGPPHTMAPFEHLHGFTPRSLTLLLQRCGFREIGTATLLRHYPAIPARSLLGTILPSLGATLRLVRPH
jgi:SAM-dependent methyltransferase